MYIQSINNSNNISSYGKPNGKNNGFTDRVMQKIIDIIPKHTTKESARKLETWSKRDNWVSKPMQNRAIMGVTAMMTQPVIDYNNKRVDKETRKMAFFNRCAVILAGTTVGMFAVRGPIYTMIEKMTNIKGTSKSSKALLPKKYLSEMTKNEKYLNNYRTALSTGIALAAMCVTNFVLDAPFTILLTNYFKDHFCSSKNSEQKENKVALNKGGANE